MHAKGGLIYWLTSDSGEKLGVPIKASSIHGKPTLKNLQERFKLNEALRKLLKPALIQTINKVLLKQSNRKDFEQALQQHNIAVIFRQNEQGRIYGTTFIDHQNKAVFNGSDLGKAYSANEFATRFTTAPQQLPAVPPTAMQTTQQSVTTPETNGDSLLDIPLQPEQQDLAALNKLKKKKRKGQNL